MSGRAALAAHYRRQDAFLNKIYRRVVPFAHRRPHAMRNARPIVSVTFDDFPVSALTEGAAILEGHGGRGTYYVTMSAERGFDGSGEPFAAEHLSALVARGHELACHTFGHVDCALTPAATLEAELDRNAAALGAVLPGYRMTSFAYPYGNVSIESKRIVGRRFASSRGIWTGLCAGTVDLSLLPAHKIYGEENIPTALDLIGEAARSNGWLILFTHDVRVRPTPFGSTPEQVERLVAAAADAGCALLSVRDALREIGVADT